MATKSAQEKLNKYSSVAENVKTSAPQRTEEPRITLEQVTQAFRSFGFEPNEKNQNDIGYWTTRPQSEGAKLMDELRKRRTEINKEEEDNQKLKKTLPRLSDNELTSLFDEYGLPIPDLEWVRNFLPNDPQRLRKILEMQRKMSDDMLKNEAKNATNTMPQANAMPTTPVPTPTPTQPLSNTGMGGIIDPNINPTNPDMGAGKVTPFFIGNYALIKLTNPQNPNSGTLWLADKKKKVLRPILSESALEAAFDNPEDAKKKIVTMSSQALGPNGPLSGFTPLTQEKGLNDDGSMDKIEFSPAQIQNHYGKKSDPVLENKALSMLDSVIGKLKPQQ